MWLQELDWRILYWLQENVRCAWLDEFMSFYTHLGSGGVIWIVTAVLLLFFRKHRKAGALMLLGLLLSVTVCSGIIKPLVQRPRPFMLDTMVRLAIDIPAEWSFPSGHSSAAAVSSTVLMLHDRRLGIPAVCVGLLMCFSRLYLFVHFPTDVLAGILIGTALGFIAYYIGGRLYDKADGFIRGKLKL